MNHRRPVTGHHPVNCRCHTCSERRHRVERLRYLREVTSSPNCPCGDPRLPGSEACATCEYLDGPPGPLARLISSMRTMGGWATIYALAEDMGLSTRNVGRALSALLAIGRVRRLRPAHPMGDGDGGQEYAVEWALDDSRAPTAAAGGRHQAGAAG